MEEEEGFDNLIFHFIFFGGKKRVSFIVAKVHLQDYI